jgi:hypothetical protein
LRKRLDGVQAFDGVETKMFIKGIGAVLLALSMTAGVADAATIFSDSFENPKNTRDWQVYQSFGSWVASSGSGIEIQTSGVAGINAHKGNQYVELDSDNSRGGVAGTTNSSMTTKLNLGAGTYRVDWYYRPRDNKADSNNIGVYLAGAGQDLFTRPLGKINKTKS